MSSGRTEILDSGRRDSVRVIRVELRRGGQHDFAMEPVRIGSGEGCDLRLNDPTVSTLHLELARSPHGIRLRDLGSTNGTYLEEHRVQVAYIDSPARVRLGNSELKVSALDREEKLELDADSRCGGLVGGSAVMRSIYAKIKKVANTDATVLVTGETGTGKELVAEALRDLSSRRDKPFVVVDCGALPGNLIESELFGHEKGAFTSADSARAGAFERAHGGTIFLDEIGELPLSLQPALLGVLQRREVRRVGGNKTLPMDVRVVCATNRDLAEEVGNGTFRSDLYYRLAIVELRMPPLRERTDDIPALVEHFCQMVPGEPPTLSGDAVRELQAYPWPGNVRELRNVIERAALLAEPPELRGDFKRSARSSDAEVDIEIPFKEQKNALIADFERTYVEKLLEATQHNVAKAARQAGIDRMYLYKLMSRHGLAPER